MTKGFAHVALYTPKLEESVKFYEEVFGAENLGFFQASYYGCWLRLGEDTLEVFRGEELEDGRFKHIAISCENVDEAYARAVAWGAEAMTAPKDICLGLREPVKARIAFVRGPGGEQLELFCRREG